MPDRRRWTVLAVGTYAQAATCSFVYGIPMLVPALRRDEHLTLFRSSLLVSAPILGLLLMLIGWGALADRYGERIVIASGVGLATVLLLGAVLVHGALAIGVLLVLAGAAGASVFAASGRVVMGWFPREERGLAMGTRQTAQPLGVALAGIGLPPIAHATTVHVALLFPTVLCAVATVLVVALVRDPPRPARPADAAPTPSPYRGSRTLLRVHLASALLVLPQFAVATFTLVYLVGERSWDPATAGRVIFAFQVAGALGRVATGIWSDRVGSRLGPMRQLATAAALIMLALGLGAALHQVWIVGAFALGAVITVADNGLAFTAVAEFAGTEWSGRALGLQNTVQNVVALATAPVLAAIIGDSRYALGFGVVALAPLLAIGLTPVSAERRRPAAGRAGRDPGAANAPTALAVSDD